MPGKVIQSMRKAKTLESAVPARRDRQDGHGFPRRSVVGAARGARPRAERDVQRPLPRGRLRPVERDVRHHGEHAQHPAAADGPHGDHPHRRLHRGREARDRQAPSAAELDGQAWARREGMVEVEDERAARTRAPLHARGGRAQSRARDLQSRAQGGQGDPDQQEEEDRRRRATTSPTILGVPKYPLRRDRGGRSGRPGDRASPGPRSAASC